MASTPDTANNLDKVSPKSNSATVIVLKMPEAVLVANTDGASLTTTTAVTGMKNDKYLVLGSFFSDPRFNFRNGFNFGGGGPFGSFPGGGGGGGPKPDNVPDSFQLSAIGGLEDQIAYLKRSVLLPLVQPRILSQWGVKPPKGILLHGPPGTGKTFMAKAIVNELKSHLGRKVNFFYRKGGDVFSMWFGESQRKLREVFSTAISMSPSVIFFDEIDGLCPSREGSANHGTEAYASVVTCFLGQMDALENGKVFVIGATNRLDAVDPAVRRPGRFDKHLAFGFPDENARAKIITIHTRKWRASDKPNTDLLTKLAQRTLGFSGADLEKLCSDVVYKAIEANGGILDNNVQITENQWLQAVSQMQRTASNNFGSSLMMPTKPSAMILKLIQPLVQKVIDRMQLFVAKNSVEASNPTMIKSLLLHITPDQSKSFLNNHIIHGILSNKAFNKISMFEISPTSITNKCLTGRKTSIIAVVDGVVNQALDCSTENPSCVIVLNINEILDLAQANGTPSRLVLESLAKARGPKVVLMATSSVPPDQIKDHRVSGLFADQRLCFQVKNPTRDQLHPFFRDNFEDEKKKLREAKVTLSGDVDRVLVAVTEKAARVTNTHNHEDIVTLCNSLLQVNMRNNAGVLSKEYDAILDNYSKNKLRSD